MEKERHNFTPVGRHRRRGPFSFQKYRLTSATTCARGCLDPPPPFPPTRLKRHQGRSTHSKQRTQTASQNKEEEKKFPRTKEEAKYRIHRCQLNIRISIPTYEKKSNRKKKLAAKRGGSNAFKSKSRKSAASSLHFLDLKSCSRSLFAGCCLFVCSFAASYTSPVIAKVERGLKRDKARPFVRRRALRKTQRQLHFRLFFLAAVKQTSRQRNIREAEMRRT